MSKALHTKQFFPINEDVCETGPPQRWSVPDKVYLGHRQLRTHQQMPDTKVTGGGFKGVCVWRQWEGAG